MKSLSRVWLCATLWTVAYQAPQSMEFSRQEYWSGLPFLSPWDLPDLGIKPGSPALQADALLSEPPGKLILITSKVEIHKMLVLEETYWQYYIKEWHSPKSKWASLMFAWVSLRQNHKDWISCTGLKGIWGVEFVIKGKWVSCKDLFKEKTSTEIFTTTVNFFALNIIIHTFSHAFILLHWINSSSFDLCQFSWKHYELESKHCFKTYFSDNNA